MAEGADDPGVSSNCDPVFPAELEAGSNRGRWNLTSRKGRKSEVDICKVIHLEGFCLLRNPPDLELEGLPGGFLFFD